ncbi:hypothetical protein [Actinoplanes derwentensis]|uniref:Alpha/beta hydrolase family protein n=1 Tax=Actinoplanes derwentensis TaxID=113562 RepID=A0A1H2AU64_9ACTN|nr:hypothetical protein [Actinoplanes derwentensis]GID84313.1 hypothetical protein Ade03nite_32370 [Actinoplanes derwentensis]SDT49443.1 hypothetical protein SAMN04489716_4096 [Actinoplanes derwentensis]
MTTVSPAAANPAQVVVVHGAGHDDRVFLDGPELLAAVEALAGRL